MPLTHEDLERVDAVVARLSSASSLLFITGAGLSADSGLPTYRGIGGLYHDGGDTMDGVPIEEALSGGMFRTRPDVTWHHLLELERNCRGATFNRGHEVIAAMEGRFPRVWTVTQNVDGFHRLAGSRNLIEIHGDLHNLLCSRPGCRYRETVADYGGLELTPRCPRCGGVIRPDVVLFGEMLPANKLSLLNEQLAEGFDAVFSVGTSSVFPYIIQPVEIAAADGALTVEVNPGETTLSEFVDLKIAAGAAETLDAIWSRLCDRSA